MVPGHPFIRAAMRARLTLGRLVLAGYSTLSIELHPGHQCLHNIRELLTKVNHLIWIGGVVVKAHINNVFFATVSLEIEIATKVKI